MRSIFSDITINNNNNNNNNNNDNNNKAVREHERMRTQVFFLLLKDQF